jgi:ubiquinone/menaquinone biosynthesis C-methylase UbiE
MLKLDRQEQVRARYKRVKKGYRPALEVYKAMASGLVNPDTMLLDAGCGEAGLVAEYQGHSRSVIGIDRYLWPIRQSIQIENVVEGTLASLPFANARFDMVMCSWVLEHLEQPEIVLGEIVRVLKPGGHFLFITPNALNYLIWARRLVPNRVSKPVVNAIYARGDDYVFPTFYRANTRRAIDTYMKRLGCECRQFEYISDPSYTAFNELTFWVSVGLERITDVVWPQSKVHLVGMYQKGI